MTTSDPTHGPEPALEADYREYESAETIQHYRRATAGVGINHLLRTTYGPVFLEHARAALDETGAESLTVLEFGCGAGMALHYLTEQLGRQGTPVDVAVGTDFIPGMIAAAKQDLAQYGSAWARERVRFVVAPNEKLVEGLAKELGQSPDSLAGTVHLAIGVNTFRYAIRGGTSGFVVGQLAHLLAAGARVVVIDMNDRFPYGLKPRRATSSDARLPIAFGARELPTLDEYAQPFLEQRFDVLRREHFCWIPHSASGLRFHAARAVGPLFARIVPDRAMRSLIVARKL
jgi:SAM-dependent methyltransferase